MLSDHWPTAGLRLNTPHLEFRHPSDQEPGQLADLAAEGIHEPGQTPSPCPGAVCLRRSGSSVVQQHWPRRGNWPTDDGDLDLAVLEDGQIVGLQNLPARDYAIVGKASTFSWLGLRHRAGASAPRCVPRSCTWPSPESMRLKRPREHSTTTPHP